MPRIVYLDAGIFDYPDWLAALTDIAALHELVLIGAGYLVVDGRLTVLREAFAPRRMVAVLIDDDLSDIEQTLVNDLLNDGVIALIVVVGDKPASPSMAWLQDDPPLTRDADHRPGPRCVTRPTPLLRRRRGGPPGTDSDKLRPAS
jgi:hypothetical protein